MFPSNRLNDEFFDHRLASEAVKCSDTHKCIFNEILARLTPWENKAIRSLPIFATKPDDSNLDDMVDGVASPTTVTKTSLHLIMN